MHGPFFVGGNGINGFWLVNLANNSRSVLNGDFAAIFFLPWLQNAVSSRRKCNGEPLGRRSTPNQFDKAPRYTNGSNHMGYGLLQTFWGENLLITK